MAVVAQPGWNRILAALGVLLALTLAFPDLTDARHKPPKRRNSLADMDLFSAPASGAFRCVWAEAPIHDYRCTAEPPATTPTFQLLNVLTPGSGYPHPPGHRRMGWKLSARESEHRPQVRVSLARCRASRGGRRELALPLHLRRPYAPVPRQRNRVGVIRRVQRHAAMVRAMRRRRAVSRTGRAEGHDLGTRGAPDAKGSRKGSSALRPFRRLESLLGLSPTGNHRGTRAWHQTFQASPRAIETCSGAACAPQALPRGRAWPGTGAGDRQGAGSAREPRHEPREVHAPSGVTAASSLPGRTPDRHVLPALAIAAPA